MRTILTTTITALLLISGACDTGSSAQSKPARGEPVAGPVEPSEHAPAGARPGSHEDWCGGHQVPESLCTRCNPSLIPAFKATGDWCPEHELPESQCRQCNPDLKIERPPQAGGK